MAVNIQNGKDRNKEIEVSINECKGAWLKELHIGNV